MSAASPSVARDGVEGVGWDANSMIHCFVLEHKDRKHNS